MKEYSVYLSRTRTEVATLIVEAEDEEELKAMIVNPEASLGIDMDDLEWESSREANIDTEAFDWEEWADA